MPLAANALCSLDELKQYLSIEKDDGTQDVIFELLIAAASDQIEQVAGRAFKAAAVTDERHDGGLPFLFARRPPIASLVVTLDPDGQATTVAATDLRVDQQTGRIVLVSDPGWPLRTDRVDHVHFPAGTRNVRLAYTGGYTVVPPAVRLACMLTVHAWHAGRRHEPEATFKSAGQHSKTREMPSGPLPDRVMLLLAPYRVMRAASAIGAPASRSARSSWL